MKTSRGFLSIYDDTSNINKIIDNNKKPPDEQRRMARNSKKIRGLT